MTVLPIEYIVTTPGVCGGRPRIKDHRVTVENIAVLHNSGWSTETITHELNLTLAEVYAALSYYYEHQAEIDQSIRDADALALREGRSLKELVGDLDAPDIRQEDRNVIVAFPVTAAPNTRVDHLPGNEDIPWRSSRRAS